MSVSAGIYVIEHPASGRKYVGSTQNFQHRWKGHLLLLRKGKHHSVRLQAAWNKYGEAAFVFNPLFICAKELLEFYEQRAIDIYESYKFGFNSRPLAGSNRGYKHTEESRAKIREKRAKQVFSAETRALWVKNRTGRKMPADFAERARQWKTGNRHSVETRRKISAAQTGIPQTLQRLERRAKFTLAKVKEILDLHSRGVSQKHLAAQYGVDPSTISNIVRGKRWAKWVRET